MKVAAEVVGVVKVVGVVVVCFFPRRDVQDLPGPRHRIRNPPTHILEAQMQYTKQVVDGVWVGKVEHGVCTRGVWMQCTREVRELGVWRWQMRCRWYQGRREGRGRKRFESHRSRQLSVRWRWVGILVVRSPQYGVGSAGYVRVRTAIR